MESGSRHRWKDNIKMGLKVVLWEGVERISVAEDAGWWQAVMDASSVKGRTFLTVAATVRFSRTVPHGSVRCVDNWSQLSS
jgi:hypothetical protein